MKKNKKKVSKNKKELIKKAALNNNLIEKEKEEIGLNNISVASKVQDEDFEQNNYNKIKILCNKYLDDKRIKEFRPIIDEVLLRRQKEFDFTIEEMESQIKNLSQRLVNIYEIPGENVTGCDHNLVEYAWQKNTIIINQDNYEEVVNNFNFNVERVYFDVLTHNIFHAISSDGKNLGLEKNVKANKFDNGKGINEAFTEVATYRVCIGYDKDDEKRKCKNTFSYPEFTYIPNLIALVLGVSEKEVVKQGITSRNALLDLVYSRFNEKDLNNVRSLFSKFEKGIDEFFDISYGVSSQDPNLKYVKRKKYLKGIEKIFDVALELLNIQICSSEREIDGIFSGEIAYRYNSIIDIKDYILNKLENTNVISIQEKTEIESYIEKRYPPLRNIVKDVNIVAFLKEDDRFMDKDDLLKIESWAIRGVLFDYKDELENKKLVEKIDKFKETSLHAKGFEEYPKFIAKTDYNELREKENTGVYLEVLTFLDEKYKEINMYTIIPTAKMMVINGVKKIYDKVFKRNEELKLLEASNRMKDSEDKE